MSKMNFQKFHIMDDERVYKRVFNSIALIICFFCVLVFAFMYMIYKDSVENVYSDYIENELESFQRSFNSLYIESKNIAMSVYMDADLRKVSEGVGATREDKIAAVRRLDQYKNFNIYVESIYFYDSSEQLLYSSEYNFPWAADEYIADSEIFSIIEQRKSFVLRQKEEKRGRLYTIIVYPFNGRGDAIVINYYSNVFSALFREGSGIVVVDNEKKCFASNFFSVGTNLSDEKYIQDIFDDNKDENTFKSKIHDNNVILSYKRTPDFMFINSESMSVIMGKIVNKVIPRFLILVAFLIVILWVLLNYGRKMNVFLYKIFTKIENMKFKIQSNENNINKNKKNDLLKNISFMNDEEIKEAIKDIEFNILTDEKMNMVIIKIDHFTNTIKETPLKYRGSITFAVMNVMEELLQNITDCDLNVMNDCDIVILYNTKDCDENSIKNVISQTQELFREKMDITISAFVGYGTDNIFGISKLYKTLCKLKEYGFYEGLGCVLTVDYMQKRSEDRFDDTLEYRIQFANILKTGSYDKMSMMFENIIKLLQNSNPSYLKSELLQFAFQIEQLVLRLTDYNIKLTDIYRNIFNDIMCAETLEEVKSIFNEIFSYISENIININGIKCESIVTRVTKLIEENYSDINFSRNTVADELNINANYADSLFKKQTSKTISTYITDYRLEKSQELLKTTDYSVNKIAELVGYTGGSYFIYSFKKKFGLTPNEYRKIN